MGPLDKNLITGLKRSHAGAKTAQQYAGPRTTSPAPTPELAPACDEPATQSPERESRQETEPQPVPAPAVEGKAPPAKKGRGRSASRNNAQRATTGQRFSISEGDVPVAPRSQPADPLEKTIVWINQGLTQRVADARQQTGWTNGELILLSVQRASREGLNLFGGPRTSPKELERLHNDAAAPRSQERKALNFSVRASDMRALDRFVTELGARSRNDLVRRALSLHLDAIVTSATTTEN